MKLSKLQRVLVALVVVVLFSIPKIITMDFSPTSLLNQLFLSILAFVFFYYLLGAFYGKKKDLPKAKYPYGAFQFARYFGLILAIAVVVGVVLLLTKQMILVIGIAFLIYYLFTFIISMIHFYYIKKLPGITIAAFSLTYLLSALFLIILKSDIAKITFIIFFTVISLFSLLYGTYVMMKYMMPQSAEFHVKRLQKRLKKK